MPTTVRSPATSARPRPARPPSPAHLHPQPNPPALSLALRARLESFATTHRRLSSVLRPSSSLRLVCCLGEFRLAASYSGHPLVCPVRAHRNVSCTEGAPPLSTRGSIAPPLFSKHSGVRTRGEQPSHAFISPSIAPEPVQLLTGVICASAGLFPLPSAFSRTPVPVLRPRLCSPCRPECA
jgi:hypothetical protein